MTSVPRVVSADAATDEITAGAEEVEEGKSEIPACFENCGGRTSVREYKYRICPSETLG